MVQCRRVGDIPNKFSFVNFCIEKTKYLNAFVKSQNQNMIFQTKKRYKNSFEWIVHFDKYVITIIKDDLKQQWKSYQFHSCTVRMSEQKLVLWVTRLQSLALTGKCRELLHPVCTDWSPDCCMHPECTENTEHDPVRVDEGDVSRETLVQFGGVGGVLSHSPKFQMSP